MPTRPHIALFLKSDRGGVTGMRLHLAEALIRRGYRVDVLLLWQQGPAANIPEGVRVVKLVPSLRKWRTIPAHYAAILPLAGYLRRERPQVLLSATTPLNIAAVAARSLSRVPVRLVISQHNPVSKTIAFKQYRSASVMAYLVRRFYPAADAVVAVSSGIAEDLEDTIGLKGVNVSVIHNPVLTDEMARLRHAPAEHAWFTDGCSPVVISVGRLSVQKAYDDLIRAFALVRFHSDARLLILGEGRQRAMLTELVGAMGLGEVVDLPGRVANPHAYMAQANLFVLSSRYEGFGNVLVEAMACGCPIVATNCLGGPVDILERGRWGGLAPVGDIKALAQSILDALSKPRDAAGLRQRAMDFHVDKIADRYCEVLGLTTAPVATG